MALTDFTPGTGNRNCDTRILDVDKERRAIRGER